MSEFGDQASCLQAVWARASSLSGLIGRGSVHRTDDEFVRMAPGLEAVLLVRRGSGQGDDDDVAWQAPCSEAVSARRPRPNCGGR